MKHRVRALALALLVGLMVVALGQAAADSSESHARAFFMRFEGLGQAFDPALADLYADEARIVSVRKYPNGPERTFEVQGTQYKALIREVMPITKARGDMNTYADVSFQQEGSRIRIRATRHSVLKGYSSSYVLVIGPNASGQWLIYEERSITEP